MYKPIISTEIHSMHLQGTQWTVLSTGMQMHAAKIGSYRFLLAVQHDYMQLLASWLYAR